MNAAAPQVALIPLDTVAPVPWRNGGGLTRELASHPPGPAWRWRLSVAEVERDGPFSRFDGVQRWFAVLEGDGVQLCIDGRPVRLTRDDAPLAFDGAASTDCTLIGGATRDFNLMVRGGAARLERLRADGARQPANGATVGVYALAPTQLHWGTATLTLAPHTLALGTFVIGSFALDNRHAASQRGAEPAGSPLRVCTEHALYLEIDA